jgi:hypothetical protein
MKDSNLLYPKDKHRARTFDAGYFLNGQFIRVLFPDFGPVILTR